MRVKVKDEEFAVSEIQFIIVNKAKQDKIAYRQVNRKVSYKNIISVANECLLTDERV